MALSRDRNFYRQFFRLIFFIALQNIIVLSVNLADNVMLGAYSENALSGVALVNQLQFLMQMLIGGVSEGMCVLTAQYWGSRDTATIKKLTGCGLLLVTGVTLVFFTAATLWGRQILELLVGNKGDVAGVLGEGMAYLRIISWTYILLGLTAVLLGSLRSAEIVRLGTVVSLTTLVVNVSLNYCLIFGRLGFPEMGTRGAALATLIARGVELLLVLVYVLCIDRKLRIRLKDLAGAGMALWRDYIRVSVPVILSGGSWGIAMFIQAAVIGRLGTSAIAANSIAGTLFQLVSVVAYAGASASAVLTGKLVGAGEIEELKPKVNAMQVIFLFIGLLTGATLLLLKGWIVSLYDVSEEARNLAIQFLLVLSVTSVGTAYQCSCLTGIVRGGGNPRFVFYNDLIFMWGLVLPASLLGAFVWKLPPVWVFALLKSDQILKCFVAAVEVNRYKWVRKLTQPAPDSDE